MRYFFGALVSLSAVFVCLPSTQAQTFTVLHSFQNTDGASPEARVVQDSSGNLYGTTEFGGAYSGGTVFKLTAKGKFSLLHSFGGTAADGLEPIAPLLLDDNGNLYGTTLAGGGCSAGTSNIGCGTVFKINSSGKESVIHAFQGDNSSSNDGTNPTSGLIADSDSNTMYGTTYDGYYGGVVYQITPSGKETILYTAPFYPTLYGSLVQDARGDLWGTSGGGNDHVCEGGCGTVFKLHKTSKGWVETTTYTFTGKADGADPWAGLVYDSVRHVFYGVTELGGANQTCYYEGSLGGCGVLFKLDSTGTKLTVLHSFNGKVDGQFPIANLILDPAGNVYGTTSFAGANSFGGTVFAYTTGGQFITLHTFTGGTDGSSPEGGLFLDRKKAVIYGTTVAGGDPTCQCGVVFSIAP